MNLLPVQKDIIIVVYVLSTYQLFESALVISLMEKELNTNVKTVLICHESVERVSCYYNMEIWDTVIKLSGYSWFSPGSINDLLNIKQWYRRNREALNQVENVKAIKRANFFIYSNGDTVLVNKFIDMHPEAIIVNVSDGAAAYVGISKEPIGKKNIIKKIIINLHYKILSMLFSCKLSPSVMTNIYGNSSTNVYWDFNVDMVHETCAQNRIVIGRPLSELKSFYKDIFNFDNIKFPAIKGKSVIFLSNLFSDGAWKLCSETDEINFNIKYLEPFIKNGYQVFVKPHPKENMDKLKKMGAHVEVLDHLRDAPFEVLVNEEKYDYIVSVGSTAMINAINLQMAHNYVILDNIFCNEVPLLREYTNFAEYVFANDEKNVYCPVNLKDLIKIIEQNEDEENGV